MAIVIVDSCVLHRIEEYYNNVEIKYPNTWNINNTIEQIDKIKWVINNFESICIWNREPITLYWRRMGWKETWHKTSPWHFAFEYICIDGKDYIYIQDAEHQDDIKESCYKTKYKIIENKKYNIINRVRLTKNQLHNIITESVKKILMESY